MRQLLDRRLRSRFLRGFLLLLWGVLCFWAGIWIDVVLAVLLGLAAMVTGTRDQPVIRPYVAVVASAMLVVAAAAGIAISRIEAPPSCGQDTWGVGGNTGSASAAAGQCFVAAATHCVRVTLTVYDLGVDNSITQQFEVVDDEMGKCHFTVTVDEGGRLPFGQHFFYTCRSLTPQTNFGAKLVELSGCDTAFDFVARPIIPISPFQESAAALEYAPRFMTLTYPVSVLCSSAPSRVVYPLFTWKVVNATGLQIAIDNPLGPYQSFGVSGSATLPFPCPIDATEHTYYLRTVGGIGPVAERTARIEQYFIGSPPAG